jgi:hypothetical protein
MPLMEVIGVRLLILALIVWAQASRDVGQVLAFFGVCSQAHDCLDWSKARANESQCRIQPVRRKIKNTKTGQADPENLRGPASLGGSASVNAKRVLAVWATLAPIFLGLRMRTTFSGQARGLLRFGSFWARLWQGGYPMSDGHHVYNLACQGSVRGRLIRSGTSKQP